VAGFDAVLTCFSGNCGPLASALPSGGRVLVAVALAMIAMLIPTVRTAVVSHLATNPQALIALVGGSLVFVMDGRVAPFVIALAVGAICVVGSTPWFLNRFGPIATRLPRLPGLPGLSLGSYVLVVGGALYVAAEAATWQFERYVAQQIDIISDEIWVTFTLPAYANGSQDLDYEERLLGDLASVLRESLAPSGTTVELVPAVPDSNGYAKLRQDFPSGARNRARLAPRLISYREGLASPVDLAVEPMYTRLSHDAGRTMVSVALLELDRQDRKLVETDLPAERITGFPDETRRAAVIIAAKLVAYLVDTHLRQRLQPDQLERIWRVLGDEFAEVYKRFDAYRDNRDFGDLDPQAPCKSRDCIEAWVEAYANETPDSDASGRLSSEITTSVVPLERSAGESEPVQ